ncbi:MAG: hypothetical protein ABIG95_03575 [Candidatus Woesearchaeota archaeon]
MTPEKLFFRYAFPCAQVLLDLKRIDQACYDELKRMFYASETPNREVLQSVFTNGFRRLKSVAAKMNKEPWDVEVIRKYFGEEHNVFIDAGEGEYAKFGEDFKCLCKVYYAEIVDKKGNVLTVKYDNTVRKVLGDVVPNAKKGDKVTVHLGFAIEVL